MSSHEFLFDSIIVLIVDKSIEKRGYLYSKKSCLVEDCYDHPIRYG
jgi:hypothetical protein